jgi:hypothetical protein
MEGFNTWLQSNGYPKGSQLSPAQARALYAHYQAYESVAPQTQGTNNQGVGGLGSMLGKFMGGGEGGGGMGGGSWGGAVGGAMTGAAAGHVNYMRDDNMRNQKDGFGTHSKDYRAHVGGAALGGVMGYYGMGAAAGPAVVAAHEVMEPATRWAINTGDKMGGAGGAMMMDPFGTVASGKYSGKELAWGAALGPAAKWFGII